IASFDSNFYCIDEETGKEIWRFQTGDEIYDVYPGKAWKGRVFVPSFDNYIYCLNAQTGKEIWRFKTGKYGSAAGPVIHKNVLYMHSRDGILYAVDENGKEMWRFKTGGLVALPTIHDNLIYVGSEDNNLYCLTMEGKEVWRFRADGDVFWKPVIKDGVIYFTSWDCHLYAVDITTRKELWRFATSNTAQAEWPPSTDAWEAEVKKETHIEDAITEEKYKSKKKGETVSLSDYQITTEYSSESEYKQKSDYDTSFVIFENIMEVERIWTSGSEHLSPDSRISM
ncbi:MAG: PQQ-like beta-propeller repeat protein, partial [Candidatus Aenigmarchaeota archaeon]|nr:PQQ-like beta-propeller repeat protein [Candidatus Aenigmarchaeota archaeon]